MLSRLREIVRWSASERTESQDHDIILRVTREIKKSSTARRGSPWSESRLDNDDHVNERSGDIVDYRETACLGTIRTDNERVTLNN